MPSLPGAILALQRSAGNAAVSALFVQRDGAVGAAAPAKSTDLDPQALAIIKAAQDDKPGIEQRAVDVVNAILDTYYADKKSMVRLVKYVEDEEGLRTTAGGKGDKVTGVISVGKYFVTDTTRAHFARRVLQVGHELEHIQQHRDGLGGHDRRHEREFLAFYHEAMAPAVPHTGKVSHIDRVSFIDEAIRNYNAFSADDKKKYADQYKELLERRSKEQRASGWPATEPPTTAAP